MASLMTALITGCSTVATQTEVKHARNPKCEVNNDIQHNTIPQMPNNMSLPNFSQGIIGWATGAEGAQSRLENVSEADISTFKGKGVTLEIVKEWQAFYGNEVKCNPSNPTAPYHAQLMKKIADLWVQ